MCSSYVREFPGDLDPVEAALLEGLASLTCSAGHDDPLDPATADMVFEAQVRSRLLDHTARLMRTQGVGYYTIGSAGHESNAAVALALRRTDPALLHYRSGGFYIARAMQANEDPDMAEEIDPVDDVLRGMFASAKEPMSGGRHKVFGRRELNIIPQTSTIASHLPRAVGLASSIGRSGVHGRYLADSVVVCSLGDASLNHSTAQGALNWAANTFHRGERVPILFVIEDNGLGISTPSPPGWVERSLEGRWSLNYASVDGNDPAAVLTMTADLSRLARESGQPAVLHLRTVRFLAHAGSDVETAYRSATEIREDYAQDPILGTAKILVESSECEVSDLIDWYLDEREHIRSRANQLASEARIGSAAEVLASLSPKSPEIVASVAYELAGTGGDGHRSAPSTLAQTINSTLERAAEVSPEILILGQDVARKGGVYGVTRGLLKRFGPKRVFDTLLDEQSIMGHALGSALNGFLPVPEIQYLAYLHNAEDQIRGEAATLSFFSNTQYKNPMVVRVAAFGYQKGFGGHFHNDNSVAVLRDIPGLVLAVPAHPLDAAPMLRTCLAAAKVDGTVSVMLEPIARYHTADLHVEGDGLWLAEPTDVDMVRSGKGVRHAPIGRARTHGKGTDLTIVTFGNGLFMSLRVRKHLRDLFDLEVGVVDLRWLAPLPTEDLLREANSTGRVLIVDETRHSGGVGEAIISELVEGGFRGPIRRLSGADSFIPLGEAANLVLVSEEQIREAALECCGLAGASTNPQFDESQN